MVWNFQKFRRFLLAYTLVIIMLTGAVLLQQRDILFPEIAGIAMGVMVFAVPHWIKKPVHVWLSPTFAALIGTSLNILPLTPLLKIWMGFGIIVILMHIFRIHFGPTIPAGLLPIFLNLHDYVFVVTTGIFTFMIMLAAFRLRKPDKMSGETSNFRKKMDTVVITIVLGLRIGLAFVTKLEIFVVPPIFALIFEVFHAKGFKWSLIPSRLAILTITAIISVGVYHLFAGSTIWVGVINVLITIIMCTLFKVPVPVAFGVSLMPLIVPAWGSWGFPIGVFVTTGVLMCFSAAYRQFRNKRDVTV
ncbi:HPP family protein [Paenibacillus sp. OAS669]|uniref:HPP family protein n=1 Tax=Paenibacillus sp. OAS669 TaxID=2663821 RepID=UPI00178A29D4|nr:HPP family protein [Paenibacillus sp. OAS669]MBE1442545.1 hypothetical protein [Paenibacillus sp. OAS669]